MMLYFIKNETYLVQGLVFVNHFILQLTQLICISSFYESLLIFLTESDATFHWFQITASVEAARDVIIDAIKRFPGCRLLYEVYFPYLCCRKDALLATGRLHQYSLLQIEFPWS